MKRLLFLAIVAAVAWYGWQHRAEVFGGSTDSEAIVVNAGTRAILRLRVTVDGQTQVREVLEPEERVTMRFKVARVSDFHLQWNWTGLQGAPQWRGGEIPPGPPRSRCTLQVFDDNDVSVACVPLPTAPGGR